MVGADGDQVAAGVGAGELDRGGGRVGAVLAELHHLGAAIEAEELLGAVDLDGRRPGEVAAADQLPRATASTHRAIGVAEPDRAVAHAVFDVLVAVDVPHVAPSRAR